MKTISKIGAAVLVVAIALSCKQAENATSDSVNEASAPTTAFSSETQKTTNTAVQSPTPAINVPTKKLIRTADIKFRVKDVAKSTYTIESTVNKFGGMVAHSNLQSHMGEQSQMKVSADSVLETTKYTVENNITIRVPNTQLDTVIAAIRNEIEYLDFRVVKADDVALKMLSNQMVQQRTQNHTKRLENNIDNKGKKLVDINEAENNILSKHAQQDQAVIDNLSLEDQVNLSTLTLALYQKESVKHQIVAIDKAANDCGSFALELRDGLQTGWHILARIIAFFVQIWSLLLIGGVAIFVLRRYLKKKSEAISTEN